MKYACVPAAEGISKKMLQDYHDAWDMVLFVHNLPFSVISTPEFKKAIALTKQCPTFVPCGRDTLSMSHLDKQDASATSFNIASLAKMRRFGFVLTDDGYKSKTKRQYHNCILITVNGPIFLGLKDVTGEGGTGVDVFDEFVAIQLELDPHDQEAIMLGILDTPSVNVKAWKLLMKKYPKQVWI